MTELGTFIVTLVGSGLGTTIVGAWFKKRFDSQLETHKALLQRSGRIHEKQVDALSAIHSKLEHAIYHLQRASSSTKFRGEPTEQEHLVEMSKYLTEAKEEFSKNKLLLSESLGRKLDEFFHIVRQRGVEDGDGWS